MEVSISKEDEIFPPPFIEDVKCMKESRKDYNYCTFVEEFFSYIPHELLIHIFQFLDASSLCNVSLVCHEWYTLSKLDEFWKNLYKVRFGTNNIINSILDRSWKCIFSNRTEVEFKYVKPSQNSASSPKPKKVDDINSKEFKYQTYLFAGETLRSKAYEFYSLDQRNLANLLLQVSGEEFSSCLAIKSDMPEVFLKFGSIMAQCARTQNSPECEIFFSICFDFYSKAAVPGFFMCEHALAFWGDALIDLAGKKEGEESEYYLHLACEKLEESIRINPDNSTTQYYWGRALHRLATKEKDAKKSTEYFLDSHSKLQRANELTPNDVYILNEHGATLHEFCLTKSSQEAEPYFELALQKYKQAFDFSNPKDAWTLRKWADTYYDWAKLIYCENYPKSESDSFDFSVSLRIQDLLRSSLQKYEEAIALDPKYVNALNSGALAASTLAKLLNNENEVDNLFSFAYERFQRAIEASPNDCVIEKCNWAMVLTSQAMKKREFLQKGDRNFLANDPRVEFLFQSAKSSLKALVDSGNKWAYFCIARICACIGDEEECQYWLKQCEDQKYLQKASFWQLTYFEKVKDKEWFRQFRQ